jgi:hypothetical protein
MKNDYDLFVAETVWMQKKDLHAFNVHLAFFLTECEHKVK